MKMAKFPCPNCSIDRDALDAICTICGWSPKSKDETSEQEYLQKFVVHYIVILTKQDIVLQQNTNAFRSEKAFSYFAGLSCFIVAVMSGGLGMAILFSLRVPTHTEVAMGLGLIFVALMVGFLGIYILMMFRLPFKVSIKNEQLSVFYNRLFHELQEYRIVPNLTMLD